MQYDNEDKHDTQRPSKRSETWQRERQWRHEESGLTVRLNRDQAVAWPKYTFCIGRTLDDSEDARLLPFVPIILDTEDDGTVVERSDWADWLAETLHEMRCYVFDVREAHNAERAKAHAERAAKQAERATKHGKPVGTMPPRTGKTERDRMRRQGKVTVTKVATDE